MKDKLKQLVGSQDANTRKLGYHIASGQKLSKEEKQEIANAANVAAYKDLQKKTVYPFRK